MNLNQNNIIIGIDTSCYTTSIAAISLDKKIIFNKKIMLKVKDNTKGLRQSEAVFQHVNNLGEISSEINSIIKGNKVIGVCVSTKPRPVKESYMPVFTVGSNFAKLFSSLNNCHYYETTHQENHIEASLLTNNIKNKDRFLSVHMSGGTTEVLLVKKERLEREISIVGGTKDISFGQLLDRIGVKMGYNFPCGKYIDENALKCQDKIDFGLKTSVKDGYMNLSGIENQINKIIDDYSKEYICKLLLDTVCRNILKSVLYISRENNINEVIFAGGVSASKYISRKIKSELSKNNITAYFTEPEYSTDNAVGCALIGLEKLNLGE